MAKKFRVLRIVGILWKILAWIVLAGGVLSSVGVLLTSLLGGGLIRQLGRRTAETPVGPFVFSAAGGVVGFILGLIVTIVYFLALYAVGELIHLMLSVEENTRAMAEWAQRQVLPQAARGRPGPEPSPSPPPSEPQPPASPAPPEPTE